MEEVFANSNVLSSIRSTHLHHVKLVLICAQLLECWILVTGRISTCGFVKHSLPADSVINVDVVLSVVSSKNYFFILKRVSLDDISA